MAHAPRPLLLALALALGATMTTACAQNANAPGYAIPADGTLLSVSAQAEARRMPDVATISAGVVTQAADANAAQYMPRLMLTEADGRVLYPAIERGRFREIVGGLFGASDRPPAP